VRNLYRNISVGPVNVRYFDPRYKPHLHAKVYLFDEFAAYVTSANLSRSGLRTNIEGGYVVRDAPAIEYFRKRFDELFGMAEDMRSKLLSELEQCWVFEPLIEPYLLYLRVLIELYPSVDDLSRRTERQLAKFQELIVGAVLHELRNKRGSLLISPTGTGKTVMAMYAAASLHQKREVDRVLVLCPNERLRAKWEQEADLFRLHVKAVTHGIVQGKGKPAEGVEQRLQRVLSQAHPGDLIIVDECHVFRNRETNGFENLARFIGDRRREDMPRLLLLSATPMSKGLADLNAQLGLIGAPALSTIEEVARAEGIINVTLPFIVKHFGTDGRGGTGTGLAYPHGLLHFGTVVTTTKSYPLPSRAAFEHIENMNLRFRVSLSELQQMALPGMEAIADVRSRSASGLLKLILLRRAESSPRAARDTIKQLLSAEGALIPDDPQAFQASLTELAGMLPEPAGDTKLHVLARMLKERPARQRVLVFSMWAATVEYLAEALPAFLGPEHRTASITGSLSFTERCKIIRRFAPAAQGRPRRQRRDDIDILIATDAIAEGEDLQDADVVVNYDLPWTPLLLIQRVGRVDRPTKHSRVIELWNFYPEEDLFERQVRLWRRLDDRADLYGRMSRTHVLGEHERQLVDLEERDLGLVSDLYAEKIDFDHLRTEYIPASEVLRDRASASSDALARAGSLPLGSRSCKVGLEPGIFMLVRVGDKLSCVFHPADAGPLEESPRVSFHERLLRHVRALPNTAVAPLPENFDETLCNLIERFARESLVEPEDVTVIVAEAIVGPERVSAEAVPVREVP
jgi:superfamily II DNA or RNA helicase